MYFILNHKHSVVPYLIKTMQLYSLTNREVARATGITEASISTYVNKKAKPTSKTSEKLWNYLQSIWRPGIIKLPELPGKWDAPYYIAVADIKNPFETWYDSNYHGEFPERFKEWMQQWKKINRFEIIHIYTSYDEFLCNASLDGIQYNTIYEHTKLGINYNIFNIQENKKILKEIEK